MYKQNTNQLIPMLVVTLSLIASGCGSKSKSGEQIAPLTAAQKAKFQNTIDSAKAISNSTGSSQASASSMSNSGISVMTIPNETEMENQITANCGVGSSFPSEGADPAVTSVTVSGAACPIDYSFSLSVSSNLSQLVTAQVSYHVKDETFKQLNDVTDLKFGIKASASQSTAQASISGSGYLISQDHGRVDIVLAGVIRASQTSQSGLVHLVYKFTDMVVKLEAAFTVTGGTKSVAYKINGVSISAEEFNDYMNSVAPAAVPF